MQIEQTRYGKNSAFRENDACIKGSVEAKPVLNAFSKSVIPHMQILGFNVTGKNDPCILSYHTNFLNKKGKLKKINS